MVSALLLALLLAALGGATALVVARLARGPDADQLRGFGYVGSAGAVALAVAVIVVAAVNPNPARAEGLAVLGFFGFTVYQLAAYVVLAWNQRPGRADSHRRPRHQRS